MSLSVAIAISGQMRTFAENREALHRMFHAAAGEGADLCYFGALHQSDSRWVDAWPWTSVTVHQMQRVSGFADDAPVGYPHPSDCPVQTVWQQWQGILAVGYLVRFVESLRARRFDWVIRCRPDLKVDTPMESLAGLSADALYFPKHDNWNGLNDRFAFGPSRLMERYFTYPNHVAACLASARPGQKIGPEMALARHLATSETPIKRTGAVLLTNRGNGEVLPARYRADRGDIAK